MALAIRFGRLVGDGVVVDCAALPRLGDVTRAAVVNRYDALEITGARKRAEQVVRKTEASCERPS